MSTVQVLLLLAAFSIFVWLLFLLFLKGQDNNYERERQERHQSVLRDIRRHDSDRMSHPERFKKDE